MLLSVFLCFVLLTGANAAPVLSDCVTIGGESFQLQADTEATGDFASAQSACESVGGNLARIDSSATFDFAFAFLRQVYGNSKIRTLIGLVSEDNAEQLSLNTERFSFVDGVDTGRAFFASAGLSPWQARAPDDSNNNEDCVRWNINRNDLWNDFDCTIPNNFLCRISCGAPTFAPSSSPSVSPTTLSPTLSPASSPTTLSPTFLPTTSPTTPLPTTSPSTSPSIVPSFSPSVTPSLSPSFSPTTSSPTFSPTTSIPTTSPSGSPSSSPSSSPTTSPSLSPSQAPSVSPTTSPTTSIPTFSPTTSIPTFSPTTSQPTFAPTTAEPTAAPSSSPSVSPTTLQPTDSPSVSPTGAPSRNESLVAEEDLFDVVFMVAVSAPVLLLFCLTVAFFAWNGRRNKRKEIAEVYKEKAVKKMTSENKLALGKSSAETPVAVSPVLEEERESGTKGEKFDQLRAMMGVKAKEEKDADELEFEALMANNGRKTPVAPLAKEQKAARPQSTYLRKVMASDRVSIFRPSPEYLDKAKQEKAKKEKTKSKAGDIDDDI